MPVVTTVAAVEGFQAYRWTKRGVTLQEKEVAKTESKENCDIIEKRRHNYAKEKEQARHNRRKELEKRRHNNRMESEQCLHNLVEEQKMERIYIESPGIEQEKKSEDTSTTQKKLENVHELSSGAMFETLWISLFGGLGAVLIYKSLELSLLLLICLTLYLLFKRQK